MKKHTLHFLLACSFFWAMLTFAMRAKGEDRVLEYTTKQVRELWQVCSIHLQQTFPTIPQNVRWPLCDCYTDYMRKNLTHKEIELLKPPDSRKLGLKIADKCEIKDVAKDPIITLPIPTGKAI